MELFKLEQRAGDTVLEVTELTLHRVDPLRCLLRHLSEPSQTLLNGGQPQNVEIVENLSVDLRLLQYDLWDFAVLPRGALD